ncbi:hypothetical protein M501DRAFT_228786 [Patellaria atrata CBS 101060]|uniref:Uncharacterized protein n=1 Tax=Patellaria atrata CBS 101060 TaxID=1346257 RepID=A0A9P4VMK7_9PEZI|nr:hypothetical protein M501DRAFT_228786 [Patellaria atrata CBS 101060]
MSIFSKIKGAKKAADEHKKTEPSDKPKPVPYKHIPTHAAQDALATAPASWNNAENKARIMAMNKRRSTMSRANSEISIAPRPTHGLARNNSDLSITSVMHRASVYHAAPYSYNPHASTSRHHRRSYLNQQSAASSMVHGNSPLSTRAAPPAEDSVGSSNDSDATDSSGSSHPIELKASVASKKPVMRAGIPPPPTTALPPIPIQAPLTVAAVEEKRKRNWFSKRPRSATAVAAH